MIPYFSRDVKRQLRDALGLLIQGCPSPARWEYNFPNHIEYQCGRYLMTSRLCMIDQHVTIDVLKIFKVIVDIADGLRQRIQYILFYLRGYLPSLGESRMDKKIMPAVFSSIQSLYA